MDAPLAVACCVTPKSAKDLDWRMRATLLSTLSFCAQAHCSKVLAKTRFCARFFAHGQDKGCGV